MSIDEALTAIQRVGTIEKRDGVLKVRFPERARAAVGEALAILRTRKLEALERLADSAQVDQALALLNRTGCRILRLDGLSTIGVWSDEDGPDLRAALRTMGMDEMPVRFLEDEDIPQRYKIRRIQ